MSTAPTSGPARRTKIVATLGPRTREPDAIGALIEHEVDVVRLNLAHDNPESHQRTAEIVRKESEARDRCVGILVDLPGPKMRTGPIAGNSAVLEAGRPFVLTDDDVEGDASRVSTSVQGLASMVSEGDEIFLADGQIVLHVESVSGGEVRTTVVRRGLLRSRKGMHIPAAERAVTAFSEGDEESLRLGLRLGADLVGLSFVRDAEDIRRVRAVLSEGPAHPRLVAKVETRTGVDHIEDIARESDAVMVARGDLGIQIPLSQVPLVQKQIIQTCNRLGTPVITATQMLESMTHSPLPSRAEATDVANAVFDGTDALMLSEETAVGDFPIEAVATMAEIAVTAERSQPDRGEARLAASPRVEGESVTDRTRWAVARGAVEMAEAVGAAAVVCPTTTGSTPRRVARFRPAMPIVAMSDDATVVGSLGMVWGVTPLEAGVAPESDSAEEAAHRVAAICCRAGAVPRNELVIVVVGPPAVRTDSIHLVRT